jgi:CheY-like chemotaxis protein
MLQALLRPQRSLERAMTHALVVDDDAQILSAVRCWLEQEGIDTVLAESATDSFHAFDMFNFDLMLIDIFMPGIDGLKAIKSFRKWAPGIPIVAMSGLVPRHAPHFMPDYFAMAMRLGASYGLHKPFQREQLMVAVKTCLGELPNPHCRQAAGVSLH